MKTEKAPLFMDRGCDGCIRNCVFNRPRLMGDNYSEEKYPCNNYRKEGADGRAYSWANHTGNSCDS